MAFIEIGWGMPSLAYAADHPERMSARPFDAVVLKPTDDGFHQGASQVPILFDHRRWTESNVGMADAQRIDLSMLPESYLMLQASTFKRWEADPAGWLDDERWEIIDANIRLYAKAAAEAGVKGFFFDEEAYVTDPWYYDPALYPGTTRQEVQDAVRERGRVFMRALQSAGDEITLVNLFGLCAWHVEQSEDALIPSFYDGWLDVIEEGTTIIDGNENGYYHVTPAEMDIFRSSQYQAIDLLAPEHRQTYLDHMESGHGYYSDLIAIPEQYGDFFFTQRLPRFVRAHEREDFATYDLHTKARGSTSIVWLWTEQFDWWRPGGERDTRATRDVPEFLDNAVSRARTHVRSGTSPEPIDEILERAQRLRSEHVKAYDR